ncbi:MAG: hypothetical protein II767_10530, partial [Proteobacteria bacterium]|nr:hypothetical protein [Pseudomonadota bacterium]
VACGSAELYTRDGEIVSSKTGVKFYKTGHMGGGDAMMSILPSVICPKDPGVYEVEADIGADDDFSGCDHQNIICAYNSKNKSYYKFVMLWDQMNKLMYWMPDVTP